jgi:NTE family protein
MKIGLALSGGGFRATVFHLGVLARLAEENRLEDVTFISTVSGGSLCAGLIYAQSGFGWPSSSHLEEKVIPQARELLTTQDLQLGLIWRALRAPLSIFQTRADDLSRLLQERWGITGRLCDLAQQPRWMINATCYETGKDWRFERFRMGDYRFGYTHDTNIPLSDALAASAGFPGLVGALALDARSYSWFKYADRLRELKEPTDPDADMQRATEPITPPYAAVHLWDGGAYDNLGLEGLHNFVEGWREGVDFLIVSDASGKAQPETYQPGPKALYRMITGIMMEQILSLRSRAIWERMINHKDPGGFCQMGDTCEAVLTNAGRKDEVATLCPQCLSAEEAKRAANMETVIRRLTQEEFERLFRHGFEVADYTLYGYYSDKFNYIGYSNSRWG